MNQEASQTNLNQDVKNDLNSDPGIIPAEVVTSPEDMHEQEEANPKKKSKKANRLESAPVTPTERKDFAKLADLRQKTIIDSIKNMNAQTTDTIMESLRLEQGMTLSVPQLESMIESTKEAIKTQTSQQVKELKSRVEIKVAEIKDKYGEIEEEMKLRHQREQDEMRKRHREDIEKVVKDKEQEVNKVKEELKAAEQNIAKTHTADLVAKLNDYNRKLLAAKEQEMAIAQEAQMRVNNMRNSKDRMISLVTDATNRVKEELMFVETRADARSLINRIPTMDEVWSMIGNGSGGMTEFIRRLNPNIKALPGGTPTAPAQAAEPIDVDIIDQNDLDLDSIDDADDMRARLQGDTLGGRRDRYRY